ncbi:MAG: hypothetical protein VX836_06620 [Pseudomonadota bacterium]|nr:hypothetical protein [Pseudomonadota bacterium]
MKKLMSTALAAVLLGVTALPALSHTDHDHAFEPKIPAGPGETVPAATPESAPVPAPKAEKPANGETTKPEQSPPES